MKTIIIAAAIVGLASAAALAHPTTLTPAEMDGITAGHSHPSVPTQDITSTGGFYCSGSNCVHFDPGVVIPAGSFSPGGMFAPHHNH